MPSSKARALLFVTLFFVAIVTACTGPSSPAHSDSLINIESLRPGFDVVYSPTLRPEATLISAKNDITSGITHLDLDPVDLRPFPLSALKTIIRDNKIEIEWTTQPITPEKTGVVTLNNSRLLNEKILVEFRKERAGNIRHEIRFPGLVTLKFRDKDVACKVSDALLYIQTQEKKREEERAVRLAAFTTTAASYRVLATKPMLSEEQRKLIVQANAFVEQKNYGKAIEKYLKAVELDPTSYPAAYNNLALLFAQNNDPVMAIFYMKHYLLLEPNANDARSAQDKIYEWEAFM